MVASSWLPHGLFGAAGGALVELLADAQDRAQAVLDAAQQLAADERVVLALVAPALGVADDGPAGQPGEHRRRDLAGVGAGWLGVHVLGADWPRRCRRAPRRPWRGRRRADR